MPALEELGAGEVVGGVVDVYPNVKGDKRIPFEPEKYNKLLGTDIAKETMLAYFSKIDLGYDPASNEVIVPSWRQDLECDADLAEEVARFFGMIRFRPHCQAVRLPQENLPSNSASRQ